MWHVIYPMLQTIFSMLVFFINLRFSVISVQVLSLITFFLSNRQIQVVLRRKSLQTYAVNTGASQSSILGFMLFLLYINDLLDIIYNIDIYVDDTSLWFKCDEASYLWQHLELAFELEYDLEDTSGSCRKCLFDINSGKTQLASFYWTNNYSVIDVKIDGSVLEEKSSFKMLGLDWSS